MRNNLPVTGRAIKLPDDANILSTTDGASLITYVNPDFIKFSGYSEAELLGQPHNIVRHPDMPTLAFKHMWATLNAGHSWMGLVKNRCKNGDHYWVSAYVTPIRKNGKTVEFQSVRTAPTTAQIEAAEKLYVHLRNGRGSISRWLRLGLGAKISLLVCSLIALGTFGLDSMLSIPPYVSFMQAALNCALSYIAIAFVLGPLRSLARQTRELADNPVSQILYTGRTDEVGQIQFALLTAQAETGAVIGRIADASDRLGGCAKNLLDEIHASNRLTVEQQVETDQIATAITQMAASIQDVARNAQSAASAAEKAGNETRFGQQLVSDTSRMITALEIEIHQATHVIYALENHSNDISHVLDVIGDITAQINMLALNAAIEAARAGDQGRGFAVVADEVRSLAARTQQSTADIQQMISALQDGTRAAVSVMEQSRDHAQLSVSQARQARESLGGIGRGVHEITEMNMQIAAAVEEQGAVSEGINRSVSNIRDAADLSVSTSQNNHDNASEALRLTSALHELTKQFWAKLH
ncbi:PAS domain-containing methyl-accepting chemotaxis protein [Pseudomonas sp. 10B1]|uniref:methyl-accepting chemotaxis protein n=2 Tax=Pseudomonas TaxID=286 RepID=UPI002B229A18|nr:MULTISPECIES: PAS domain-containing methyl-accepting chemotaxis protein [unclassified Pseudomonas]MEA9977293.1 PAS domain-containing methyl-accepting chemotaxis protein [Pseudomonas sp. RTS4]MEA9994003.1 PAS domain-containing methyl-accepting chemotaxis protein [Pseudomonas sp. AA4]MEB0088662.1 PAS domain-containing methyl-accepting chemotaxis protein [Pseudomonas sp. RTI1]MEB0124379.1 PAS domain-containing methyl-accepting chemotaxis protein [Pseudomonas sp. CCC1.2]MEB0151855.1 PAS domain-